MQDAPERTNESETRTSINAKSTQDRSADVLAQTKSDLRAIRTDHGAKSDIGIACSNIDEMLENFAKATDPEVKTRLAANIQKQNARLAELLAAARS